MHALIDADILLYRCGFAAEKTFYLTEIIHDLNTRDYEHAENAKEAKDRIKDKQGFIWTRKEVETEENCLRAVDATVNSILRKVEEWANESVRASFYLTGSDSFREQIATIAPYKGNREGTPKPTHYKAIGEHLIHTWGALTVNVVEADDAIASQHTKNRKQGQNSVIVTTDKDLDQIPGWHYNWVDDEFYEMSPRDAKMFFFEQLLSGDPVDNIKGIPGIGPAKAKKALAACASPEMAMNVCIGMYEETFGNDWKKYLIENARLVYMRRSPAEDWLETKEARLVA